MRYENSSLLDTGDAVPTFELRLVSGKKIRIPDDLGDGFTVLFFYRGYW